MVVVFFTIFGVFACFLLFVLYVVVNIICCLIFGCGVAEHKQTDVLCAPTELVKYEACVEKPDWEKDK